VVCTTGEKDILVITFFSASFIVTDVVFRLPLAVKTSWCVLVVVGFTYSPVNPLFLLEGLGVIVSIKRVVRRGSSSSDPLVLLRFPRFSSINVSTCCLEDVPDVGLLGTLSLFGFLWFGHTSMQSGSGGCAPHQRGGQH
jgi:hypothetical protein